MMRIVDTSRSPFELYVLAAMLLGGTGGLLAPDRSGRVVGGLPPWAQHLWYAVLVLAALAGFAGALTRRLLSLFIERGALTATAILATSYAIGITLVAGATVSVPALLVAGLPIACITRVMQLNADIRRALDGGRP